MFPTVGIKDDTLKDKIKQRKWDQRFTNQNHIPEYSPMKDRHTKSYRKILSNTGIKQKNQTTPVKNKQHKSYFEKKVQLFDRLKSIHPIYLSHIQQFQDFLTSSKLPNFYIYYSILPLIKQIDINGFILKLKKSIKQQTSSYHRISTSIKARQQCLIQIKQSILKFKINLIGQKLQQTKRLLKDEVAHYRTLTANSIDEIKKWRDTLGNIDQKAIYYTQTNNQNYLIKILNDNQFMFNSELGNYINFAEKNDPFIIIPLKKAQGKQSTQFIQILQTQKNLAYYQKYMQYLATQKAYQLSLVTIQPIKKVSKYPQIQKIYKTKSNAKNYDSIKKQTTQLQQFIDGQTLQKQKIRQERLKKNQQRINAIKSVYESYSNKIKIRQMKKEKKQAKAETDNQGNNNKQHDRHKQNYSSIKSKKSLIHDNDFDKLVKLKYQRQKDKKLLYNPSQKQQINLYKQLNKQSTMRQSSLPLNRQTRSLTKLPKVQDKIIDNLKQIQSTLKSKLSYMKQQGIKQESIFKKMNLSGQKFNKKNNQSLISQLKNQIIKNLQIQSQQRQAQRAKRRKQQQKAIEQIKLKMKKQMEEKLQQKKKQKLIQKQQLQKKLKQEEQRLEKQRQLQIQLQIKLAKQKQLRELQKIKRQSLQKQKKYKEQLQKQQKLRRLQQQAIQRQRRQKQKILQQLKKKQLKQQIQNQIKQQMKSKYGQNPKLYDKQDMSYLRAQKQQQLTKQIQLLKLKQNQQIQHIRKQNQLRQRMLKLKRQQQQLKRKQVQHLMKSVIQQQKQDLHRETLKKRIQLQEEIKINAKEKLLEEYKQQRQDILEKNKMIREKQLEEQVYREKIKQKIEKQMRIQAIQKTKKQMEERQTRKYQMNIKMEHQKSKFDQSLQQDINKDKIQSQVKKQLIQKVIFDKQAQRQMAKNDLRLQFQRQLMASSIPQIYQQNQTDPIIKKNISTFKGDQYLQNKLSTLQKPTNQKAFDYTNNNNNNNINIELGLQTKYQSPQKQSLLSMPRNQSVLNSATKQQLQILSKKKKAVDDMRDQPSYKLPEKLSQEEDQGFQLMRVERDTQVQEEDQFQVKVIRKNAKKSNQQPVYQRKTTKNKQKHSELDSQDSSLIPKSKKSKHTNKNKKKYQSEEEDSQDNIKNNKKKVIKKKKNRQSDQPVSSEQDYSKKSPTRKGSSMLKEVQTKFEQKLRKGQVINNKQNIRQTQQQKSHVKVYFDAQKSKIANTFPDQSKIQIRQTKQSSQSKYEIRLQAIPQGELDQYLSGHFDQLPQIQKLIQLHQRQQLYRKLINQLTFCMLLGYQKDILVGMVLAFHDRNKTDLRKFQIVHISTYQNQHLSDFLISCVNYIFKKDPTDQIQFYYKFNQQIQEQLTFSTQFNKWFDKYGSVYQKKIEDEQYQRKYVLKRQFNQKCQVILGGVNKNTFRNLFTVYCGVMMSDSDMIQFKDQLKSIVTPENQVSYAISIAELFRTYLTPDQAESLKNKVKQFAKLKELLVLVVMLQKKKVKMDELKLTEYKNLIQLNMRLMSQGKDVIRYCKDGVMDMNRIYYAQLSQAFNLPFNFQTTSLPILSQQSKKIHQISYFRLSPLPPNKLHIIKSSLYNSQFHILPTQNSKYKLFIINGQQYNQIKQLHHLDIFMYIRLFLKNVKSHNTASWRYVWLPEMTDKASYNVRQFKSFLNKDIYCHDSINITYKQFLPNAMIIEPQHRDLVITPPFIVGIMSMSLEQVTEGSPLYARLIDFNALRTIEIEE